MKLLFLIDPIETLHPEKDTSFALMLAAQEKGYTLFYALISELLFHEGEVKAPLKPIQLSDKTTPHFKTNPPELGKLSEMDAIFMRKDPPVGTAYLHACQLLDLIDSKKTKIINRPSSLIRYNEKLSTFLFPELTPPTLVSADFARIKAFVEQEKVCIAKPIDEMGGRNVFKLSSEDPNLAVIIHFLSQNGNKPFITQRFLPEIRDGDKRILVIKGKALPYALARLPLSGSIRANLAAGGKSECRELSASDRLICDRVSGFLIEKGLDFVGLDVIGDRLTEINITSPTCLREIENARQENFSHSILDTLLK